MGAFSPGTTSNLTGLWHGQFTSGLQSEPQFFVATLLEAPEWLSGSVQEVAKTGPAAGSTLYATLLGQRNDDIVTFIKTYELPSVHHSIHYSGVINADQTEIEGVWNIPGDAHGTFLMIRSRGMDTRVVRSAIQPVI
jgi:hypothetical protein